LKIQIRTNNSELGQYPANGTGPASTPPTVLSDVTP
jgi:hypothetical protein